MNFLELLIPSGDLKQGPYFRSLVALLIGAILSHLLTAPVVTAQIGLVPFVVTQIALLWWWFALIVKRLRDAERSFLGVTAVALIDLFALLLLAVMLVLQFSDTSAGAAAPYLPASLSLLIYPFVFLFNLAHRAGRQHAGSAGRACSRCSWWRRCCSRSFIRCGRRRSRPNCTPRNNAAFRLWLEHEPRTDAAALSGRAAYWAERSLRKHRFVIMANGYASVVPAPSSEVHGVLWRITPRDLAALDAYENIAGGLYRRVLHAGDLQFYDRYGLIYLGCEKREGRPRKGYMELVVEAARETGLPAEYIEGLARYSAGRFQLSASSGTGDRI